MDQTAAAIRGRIGFVIRDGGDRVALRIVYRDSKGVRTERYISPTSWSGHECSTFNALCLTTGETRKLYTARVESAVQVAASDMLIPMPKTVLTEG